MPLTYPTLFRPRRARLGPRDVPPPPPAGPATVVGAVLSADGLTLTLTFDRPVALAGTPPYDFGDGAFQVNDQNPAGVAPAAADALAFAFGSPLAPGQAWNLNTQPTWLATPVVLPQTGTVAS